MRVNPFKRITRVFVFAALLALPAVLAAQQTTCPPTPPPSSTVHGGLDVVGTCLVDQVTVNGGITIESGGHLQLTSSFVNGGIVTLPCGEIDLNATTNGGGVPTGTTDTVNGGIDIQASTVCPPGAFSDVDIWTAQIDGGIFITGSFGAIGGGLFSFPAICNNTIKGNVNVDNLTTVISGVIGDPDGSDFFGRSCPGNVITGAFRFSNSSVFAVEFNTIGGSALLTGNNTLEFNGNAIGGSAKCSSGTTILPADGGDQPNTVHGSNQCP